MKKSLDAIRSELAAAGVDDEPLAKAMLDGFASIQEDVQRISGSGQAPSKTTSSMFWVLTASVAANVLLGVGLVLSQRADTSMVDSISSLRVSAERIEAAARSADAAAAKIGGLMSSADATSQHLRETSEQMQRAAGEVLSVSATLTERIKPAAAQVTAPAQSPQVTP